MKKLKKALSLTLAFVLALALAVPAFAITPEEQVISIGGETYDRILLALLNQPADEQAVLKLETDIQLTNFAVVLGASDYGGMFNGDVYTIAPHDVVIDLNGHIMTSEEGYPAFEVQDGYTLTIIDSSAAKTGKLVAQGDTDVVVKPGGKYVPLAAPEQPTTPTIPAVEVEDIPARGTAKMKQQNIEIDGRKVAFQTYMLLDENGNGTNYVKLRDIAHVLNGTGAQFSVDYDQTKGTVSITPGAAYQDNGSEMSTPFSGSRAYKGGAKKLWINGTGVDLTAITLKDDNGGGYTYFKLRDLGAVLDFSVNWSKERGVYIESDKPYVG